MISYAMSMIGRHKVVLWMERFPPLIFFLPFYLDHGRVDLVEPEEQSNSMRLQKCIAKR